MTSNGGIVLMLSNVARAQGLAQALASPIVKDPRPEGVKEVAAEIVALLEPVRRDLLRGER